MTNFRIILAVLLIWGLCIAIFVAVVDKHHPIACTAALLTRATASVRKSWSAR